jgi:hypothetical protein
MASDRSNVPEAASYIQSEEFKAGTGHLDRNVEKAVWLVQQQGFGLREAAVTFKLSPNVVRSAVGAVHGGRDIGHVGRPRALHKANELDLVLRIQEAQQDGHPLTRPQCVELANEIFTQQLVLDRAAGRISLEKEIEWIRRPPRLSSSHVSNFLQRHPELQIRRRKGTLLKKPCAGTESESSPPSVTRRRLSRKRARR